MALVQLPLHRRGLTLVASRNAAPARDFKGLRLIGDEWKITHRIHWMDAPCGPSIAEYPDVVFGHSLDRKLADIRGQIKYDDARWSCRRNRAAFFNSRLFRFARGTTR